MDKQTIERINFLARKEKAEGLSAEEKIEQTQLRAAYKKMYREELQAQLDMILIQKEDGSYEKLQKKD